MKKNVENGLSSGFRLPFSTYRIDTKIGYSGSYEIYLVEKEFRNQRVTVRISADSIGNERMDRYFT